MNDKTAYPLCWPSGRPRTLIHQRRHNHQFRTLFVKARTALIREIKLLNGTDLIFSSDLPLRNDGLPYANAVPKSGDTGVAVYFMRKQKQMCFACDCYLTVDDNLHAVCLTISALRGISRWGTGDMMESAFRGYAALPEKSGSAWFEVLGVPINASVEQVRTAYLLLCKKWHPDVTGGDAEMFRRVAQAWEECPK